MRQPGITSGVEILKTLANSTARERLSACASGSPAAFISHFEIVLHLEVRR
jgi:hypothetical protein